VQIRPGDESCSGSVWIDPEVGVHVGGVQSDQEEKVQNVDVPEVKEDGGSPSGGGDELIMLDSLV
jgi:hypothetical protein